MGKVVLDGYYIAAAHFVSSLYKLFLKLPPALEDIKSIDVEVYNSLKWMLENPIEGLLSNKESITLSVTLTLT